MTALTYPYFAPTHHGPPSTASPIIVLLLLAAMLGLVFGILYWALEIATSSRRDVIPFQRARRFRTGRRAGAAEAGADEDVVIRVHVVEPPGGLVQGWGPDAAAWTRLIGSGSGREDFVEEQGEIVVEDAAGMRVDVASKGIDVTGLDAPGVDPDVHFAYGTMSKLPERIAQAFRERGYALEDAESPGSALSSQTEQLRAGENLWLVGPIRRIEAPQGSGTGGSGYREHHEPVRFVSEGEDRFLVRAETEAQATAQLEAAASTYRQTRRAKAGWGALTLVSLVLGVYAIMKL
jgi:hypothetical protein